MNKLDLNPNEIIIIENSLNTRIVSINSNDDGSVIKSKEILSRLNQDYHLLKSSDFQWIVGCFQQHFIDSNLHLIKMSDNDIMLADKDIINEIGEISKLIKVRDKLLSKKDLKDETVKDYNRFLTVEERFNRFKDMDKILYSGNPNIYKAAILFKDGSGVRYDDISNNFNNFEFENIIVSDYTSSMSPSQFIKLFHENSRPAINQIITIASKYLHE